MFISFLFKSYRLLWYAACELVSFVAKLESLDKLWTRILLYFAFLKKADILLKCSSWGKGEELKDSGACHQNPYIKSLPKLWCSRNFLNLLTCLKIYWISNTRSAINVEGRKEKKPTAINLSWTPGLQLPPYSVRAWLAGHSLPLYHDLNVQCGPQDICQKCPLFQPCLPNLYISMFVLECGMKIGMV